MKNTSSTPPSGWLSALRKAVAVVAITGVSMGSAMAVTLAGTTIGNQAAATYTDASLTPRTATSNTVITIVAQVAAFTLTANQSQVAAPGAPVNFPHTITNTGNGTDSFSLAAVVPAAGAAGAVGTGIFSTVGFNYYIDANCNGVADNAVTITSVTNVAAGASACFVAVSNVPVGATSGQTGTLPILATSAFATATTATNTDTVTVSSQAIINVTKSISVASGAPGTPAVYTLTYTNTGNSAAANVILADFLPTNVTYAGTPMLNGAAITPVTAAITTADLVNEFDYGVTLTGRVTALIKSVAAGQSGTLSFAVTMGSATAPITAAGVIKNNANYCYNDGAAQQPATCTVANAATVGATPTAQSVGIGSPTNTAVFTILQTAAVAANSVAGNSTIGGGGAANVTDTSTVASVAQGATVVFTDYIHNNGNGTDTFNLSLANTSFPAGTTFLLFKTDGVTPLVDTNTIPDGIVDTGPIAANAAYAVVVKAVLPSGVSGVGVNYTNVLTATSSINPTGAIGVGFDTVNNVLTTVTPNSVDLINGAGVSTATTAQGLGANTGTATPVLVNPGAAATYPLFVNNTSTVADSYVVTASAMPAGWTVSYFFDASATQGLCTTLGGHVTNTGVVNGVAGAVVSNKVVCAVVASPASALPGANPITFTATSPTTGVSDTKAEIVTVNTVRSITLTPPNAGQVFPSGSVVYTHTLTNTGNVAEVAIGMTDPMTGVSAGWANVVYLDNPGAGVVGVLDPADTVVSGTTLASLAPGASVRLFAKVLSPASAAAGDINTSSLTATITGVINTVAAPAAVVAVDNTTVIVGQVLLVKSQMLDLACAGNLAAAFSNAPIPQLAGAIPGACIVYQITATNVGTAPVNNVVVSDATPANTAYACKGALGARVAATGNALVALTGGGVAVATAPGTCTAGTVSSGTIPSLAPGASAVLTFGVQINP